MSAVAASDDERGDPLVVGDEDPRRPQHERVQQREQDDLDAEPDGAGEEPDCPHEPRGARNAWSRAAMGALVTAVTGSFR